MVDQEGKKIKMEEFQQMNQANQAAQVAQANQAAQAAQVAQANQAAHQQQLQQAFLSEIRSFDEENRAKKRPRTSDADFNKDKTNLIVNYLPQSFTDQEFFNLFSTVGKVNKARIIRHRQTGYSYGYGFIDMATADDADKAIKKLNQYQIGHKRLKVAYSLPSGERTRNINLYIKGLPKSWTKRDLENAFRPFGEIRNARILLDPATQMGTGVGFLLYAQKHMAEKASEAMNGKTLNDGTEPLQISFARSQSQPPLEWILQTSLLQSYQGVAPQATSAYKGRRYNPIVRPNSGLMTNAAAQRTAQPIMLANQQVQPMIMVPYSHQFAGTQRLDGLTVPTSASAPHGTLDGTMTFANANGMNPANMNNMNGIATLSGQPQTVQAQAACAAAAAVQQQQHQHHQQHQQHQQHPHSQQQHTPTTMAQTMQAMTMPTMGNLQALNPAMQLQPLQAQPFQQHLARNYFSTGVM